jgi:leader peptidase (prepilin peptidase)/N-methyltransferase
VLTALLATVIAVRDRTATVPHGPSMCVASLAAAALAVF